MRAVLIGVLVGCCLMVGGPFAAAMVVTALTTPAVEAQRRPTVCTSDPAAVLVAVPDAEEGGIGFQLPPAGEPRRASLTNPPTPISPDVAGLYRQAAEVYRLPWTLLAGIGMAETNHGRLRATSTAGAQGLMQFMPATFAAYGVDGDGDGRAEIWNDADSIHSAANYLTASGVSNGPDGVRDALFAYNRANWYVNDVLAYAHHYGGGVVLGEPTDCGTPLPDGDPDLPALTGQRVQQMFGWGREQLGEPYVFGSNGPHSWDCSSFTQGVLGSIGIRIPRTSAAQRDWLAAGNGFRVPPGQEQPGDFVFTNTWRGPNQVGHVMLVYNPDTHTSLEAQSKGVGFYDYTVWKNRNIYQIWRPGNLTPTT